VLGNTAWKINPNVYHTLTALWEAKSTAGMHRVGLERGTPPDLLTRDIVPAACMHCLAHAVGVGLDMGRRCYWYMADGTWLIHLFSELLPISELSQHQPMLHIPLLCPSGGLPCQIPLRSPPPPPNSYRLLYEGGGLSVRGGGWSRLEARGYVLACDDVRRLNRNMASLKADFLLKKQVGGGGDVCVSGGGGKGLQGGG